MQEILLILICHVSNVVVHEHYMYFEVQVYVVLI